MLTRLLQTLRFSLVPEQDLSLELIPIPHPRSGLLVTVTARQAASSAQQEAKTAAGSAAVVMGRPITS
jgi:hypothetical protein